MTPNDANFRVRVFKPCSMIIQRPFASSFAVALTLTHVRGAPEKAWRGTFVSDDTKCHGTQRAAGLSEWTEHNWAERWDQTLKNAAIAALSTEAVQITHTYMQLRYTMGRCERFSLSWAQTYQRSYALGVLYCRNSEIEAISWLIPPWCNGQSVHLQFERSWLQIQDATSRGINLQVFYRWCY